MEKKVDRRRFLRSTVLGTAGTLAAARMTFAGDLSGTGTEAARSEKGLITRRLGKTDMVIPVVSMGVMRADNPNLVKAALDKGMTLLDTAYSYQGGRNEEMLGKLLKDYPRDAYYIETKVKPDSYDKKKGDFTDDAVVKKSFRKRFDTSMKRLGIDYVDVLFLHAINTRAATLNKAVLEVMREIKKEGRTRYLGVSTHSHEPEVIRAAIDSGVYDVVLVAYNYRQNHKDEIAKAFEEAAKAGVGIIAMKTMAGGKKPKDGPAVSAGTALKWALQNEHVATAIPGFTTFDQLDEDIAVAGDLTLSQDEKQLLAMAMDQETLYCDGCTQCLDQCRHELPIPDLMRAYMYTYGYRETRKARDLLDELAVTPDVCATCAECTVSCTKGFAVAEKIRDVTRLREVPPEFLT
jgi:predicted aldo/keto reductase-like oxidoreductase